MPTDRATGIDVTVLETNYWFFVQGKKTPAKADPVEMGTQQDDVDYAWLPKETTTEFSKYQQFLKIFGLHMIISTLVVVFFKTRIIVLWSVLPLVALIFASIKEGCNSAGVILQGGLHLETSVTLLRKEKITM